MIRGGMAVLLCLVLPGCTLLTRTDKGDLDVGGDGGVDPDAGPPPPDARPDPDAGPTGADRCTEPGRITLGETVTHDTTPLRDDVRLSCTREARNAPDAVYAFTNPDRQSVSFDTFGSEFDTVLAALGFGLACGLSLAEAQ